MQKLFFLFGLLVIISSSYAVDRNEFVASVKKLVEASSEEDKPLFTKLLAAAEAVDDSPASIARYLVEQATVSDLIISKKTDASIEDSMAAVAELAAAAQNLKTVGAPEESERFLNKAAEHGKKLASKNPTRPDLQFMLAKIYFYLGSPEKMRTALNRCLELAPNDSGCRQELTVLNEAEALNRSAQTSTKKKTKRK